MQTVFTHTNKNVFLHSQTVIYKRRENVSCLQVLCGIFQKPTSEYNCPCSSLIQTILKKIHMKKHHSRVSPDNVSSDEETDEDRESKGEAIIMVIKTQKVSDREMRGQF